MIGAIIGDVVGSRFEFNNIRTKKFELISKESVFTDDTVLTIAVMDWLCHAEDPVDKKEASRYLQKWARKYPNSGFGGMFHRWMHLENPEPYNSCGNGSAMRISPVAWMLEDEEDMLDACRTITSVTHNHPEGMKGAEVTAQMIFKAKNGATMEELYEYAVSMYPEIASMDYEDLRQNFKFDETCQKTVPQAIYCFLISKDFEDCLRTTISIGGDCDTTAAISCAIAEVYYDEIPTELVTAVKNKLTKEMIEIIDDANWIYMMK